MNNLSEIEKSQELKFPTIYKEFYQKCMQNIPDNMIGTDLYNEYKDLKESALELLFENSVDNFLSENDFVFMMHQGYMFWYFKADGNENPNVYFYHELDKTPKKMCSLKSFLKRYPYV